MKKAFLTSAVVATLLALAAPAFACGGLIGRNGAVNLVRTTTLAGYHEGIEHYITSFQFAGGGGQFGSIVPLPGIPSKVERGGDWTLQRLIRETQVLAFAEDSAVGLSAKAAPTAARVVMTERIDALDLTVLEGGGDSVGEWAKQNGFLLPPDAPEILDFYADRSPIFLAAKFDGDAAAARGQALGDGTPVHLSIPTRNPWVPLRILGLGKQGTETINADVYLLTDEKPNLLPASSNAFVLDRSEHASDSLINDLRSDKGMSWIPASGMWLNYLRIDGKAKDLKFDLAIDVHGEAPSRSAAGFPPLPRIPSGGVANLLPALVALMSLLVIVWWNNKTQVGWSAGA